MVIYEVAVLGILGGLARAAVGMLKALRNDVDIVWKYAAITVFSSAVVGAVAGILFDSDPKISLIAGYAGMDLLENVYKIVLKKKLP